MTRDTIPLHSIALLATGDEISNGDILNSNAQEIAQTLFNNGMHIGMHMVTGDRIAEIEAGIRFLLQSHRALIITGGLGPTSDDLTRYALGNALQRELFFDTKTWVTIVERLTLLGYQNVPETNRQQALFPAEATIIPNPNGTASGCIIQENNQFIFMLPGPPVECLPMVESLVLPTLQKNGFQNILHYEKWLLFGVSEGQIAEELDALAKPFDCVTGYRLWYPYIEFKIYSNSQPDFTALVKAVQKKIAPYIIHTGKQSASDLLKKELMTQKDSLNINDLATGGLLESIIKIPQTHSKLYFSNVLLSSFAGLSIQIKGLDEYWQNKPALQTTLEITFTYQQTTKIIKQSIPFRGRRVKQYAVEFICKKIYEYLTIMR